MSDAAASEESFLSERSEKRGVGEAGSGQAARRIRCKLGPDRDKGCDQLASTSHFCNTPRTAVGRRGTNSTRHRNDPSQRLRRIEIASAADIADIACCFDSTRRHCGQEQERAHGGPCCASSWTNLHSQVRAEAWTVAGRDTTVGGSSTGTGACAGSSS